MTQLADGPKLLFVDDEPNVTAGIQRTFFDEFDIDTAESGEEALQLMESDGPYAVLVSDMRMPHMDGATLLARARRQSPNTVRMLLTGYTDLEAAVAAVNEGNIFRFLCKPCPEEILRLALRDAIRQHDLVNAEKQLLEDTLKGTVAVLVEVLSLAAPAGFARSDKVKACVSHLAEKLGITHRWELELAAMLSHLGYVAIPPDVISKLASGQELDADEKSVVDDHPTVAHGLLNRIPRLEGVAELVLGASSLARLRECHPERRRDAGLLAMAMELDRQLAKGASMEEAIQKMAKAERYQEAWLTALRSFETGGGGSSTWTIKKVLVADLLPGMRLEEDVLSPSGGVLVPKGREVSSPLIERLKNFARRKAVVQPIVVATRWG